MARVKKTEAAPPPPKSSRDVKHGCCSCKHYKLDVKAFPCRDCEQWNYWEDSELSTVRSPGEAQLKINLE